MTTNNNPNRSELITNNIGLVHHAVKKMGLRGATYDDAVGVGQIALVKAADGYDPTKGVRFSTYATYAILNSVREMLRSSKTYNKYVHNLVDLTSRTETYRDDEINEGSVAARAMRDAQLSDMELRVIECRFGIGCEPMTLKATAAQLGITLQQAHAIERDALARMREEANK